MKNTKELRSFLADTLTMIRDGDVSPADGRNIVGAANQINISINNELKKMKLDMELGKKVDSIGNMKI